MKSLKEIFDSVFLPLFQSKNDLKRVSKLLYQFQIGFINKGPEYLEFFGSNLTGNIKIVFTTREMEMIFEEILGVSKELIDYYIKNDSNINKDFKISSDSFNITCVYLAHMFKNNKLLDSKESLHAAKVCCLLFLYRCVAAILNHYFKYPISRDTAEAIYAHMSNRYLLKKLGSWAAVLNYRADDMLSKTNPNAMAMIKFMDDDVVKFLNDSQSRIKDTFKNIYAAFIEVRSSEIPRTQTTSSTTTNIEGDEEMIDISTGASAYINYILGVLPDQHSFIKNDVLDIISNIVTTTQRKYIEKALVYMSQSMSDPKASIVIEDFVRKVLTYAYDYLKDNKYLSRNSKNIVAILGKLKGVFMAARNNEASLVEIRDIGDTIIKAAIAKINKQAAAATRSSVILYICLRCFAKHHFME